MRRLDFLKSFTNAKRLQFVSESFFLATIIVLKFRGIKILQSCDESEKRQSLKCDEKWILSGRSQWPTISAKFQSWVDKIMIMKRYKKNKKLLIVIFLKMSLKLYYQVFFLRFKQKTPFAFFLNFFS